MEDHCGEGNNGGIRISSDELCKHLRIRDGGREHQDGVDDEAGEEEEEPKLEHDKHEGHSMAGSAATSNLGSEGQGAKRPRILSGCSPRAPSPPHPMGAVAQRVVDVATNLPATRGDEETDMMKK
uniref:Uncharacterized protein n=1 Tax=Oryza meridionalis TaxID=40149 RepID=A0A0E0F4C5_9ORYZ